MKLRGISYSLVFILAAFAGAGGQKISGPGVPALPSSQTSPRQSAASSVVGLASEPNSPISILADPDASPRELYGVSRLKAAFETKGFNAPTEARVLVAMRSSELFAGISGLPSFGPNDSEAFRLLRRGNRWLVVGSDASGVLYGCMELARRSEVLKTLPPQLEVIDKPAFRIRATNLFWMKTGGKYDWEIAPTEFPWFYDRKLMTRYLDELAENRYNTLVFWSGHPFPYFLPLSRYPEARMLSDAELAQNMAYLKWFTAEADKRGIWTVFEFFNIHVSPAFAEAHKNEGVHLHNSASTPLLAAYTRYCVGQFVKTYPNVGLMVTAGEALKVDPEKFVRDVIIPGIKDSGKNPPLIVRQWTIDPDRYREFIKPNYGNLFTMMKHNTEMIVSPYPDPRNKTWIALGPHIINMHEMADVKPFRWGSPVFIEQMVQIWKNIGASGFQIYPMTSWMWPYSLDKAPLLTMNRDRIWLEAFGRYGWNPDRPAAGEELFWKSELAAHFGTSEAGSAIYDFYVNTGPILPGLQNIVNIYNMNYHPTAVAQEATLNGILHSDRWEGEGDFLARPLDNLTLARYEKEFGPVDNAARMRPPLSVKEFLGPHAPAPDPVKVSLLFVQMAGQSLQELRASQPAATGDPEEYRRLIGDATCILDLARFYHSKIEAAVEKGRYDATGNDSGYRKMLEKLDASVEAYRSLEVSASSAYRHPTDLGDWYSWSTVLHSFEKEDDFYHQQERISTTGADVVYLGLDGPMSDATNGFHWLLEQQIQTAGLTSQSYHLGKEPFRHARLIVVYDTASPAFRRYSSLIEAFVRRGGKLLIWDPMARACTSPLLNGITFTTYSAYRPGKRFTFTNSADPLLQNVKGEQATLSRSTDLAANIQAISSDWHPLAYTILTSLAAHQFDAPGETFGPRWTSLMDPVRVPLLVVRHLGKGEIVLAQLGNTHIHIRSEGSAADTPAYLQTFTKNLSKW
jgi:hypothetical protein